jgi:D-alanyl-D-alanine carboxypeptidase
VRANGLVWVGVLLALGVRGPAAAQEMAADTRAKVDAAIRQVVEKTGVPSASVGVVEGGRVVFAQAYGSARLKPERKAEATMSYPVGSISKQFTATCILLLEEDGKLTLDDTVSRWYPGLTRASEVTLRELLSHTSGYEDYAPQDYTIPAWTRPNDPEKLVREWAGKPLDFDPGTQWQYSNTNFVLAALIVQKASGMPYFDFLRKRVLDPLGMRAALNLDTDRAKLQVEGYERRALAPLRPAVLEAPGWYFGDASLAMPVGELLRWDIAVMNRTLLKPKQYAEFTENVALKNGKATGYGLGISVLTQGGRQVLEHSGEVGGFVAENLVVPEEKLAIAVLTNQEASSAAGEIAGAIGRILLAPVAVVVAPESELLEETQIRKILSGLEDGTIDRALFTEDANFYFSAETLGDFSSSLKPLGTVTAVKKRQESLRGGMVYRGFTATFSGGTSVAVSTYSMKDGRLEQLLVEGKE